MNATSIFLLSYTTYLTHLNANDWIKKLSPVSRGPFHIFISTVSIFGARSSLLRSWWAIISITSLPLKLRSLSMISMFWRFLVVSNICLPNYRAKSVISSTYDFMNGYLSVILLRISTRRVTILTGLIILKRRWFSTVRDSRILFLRISISFSAYLEFSKSSTEWSRYNLSSIYSLALANYSIIISVTLAVRWSSIWS